MQMEGVSKTASTIKEVTNARVEKASNWPLVTNFAQVRLFSVLAFHPPFTITGLKAEMEPFYLAPSEK